MLRVGGAAAEFHSCGQPGGVVDLDADLQPDSGEDRGHRVRRSSQEASRPFTSGKGLDHVARRYGVLETGTMPPPHVVVVGGGLAGLAASVALAGHGIGVSLLEKNPRLGGRATSYRLPS